MLPTRAMIFAVFIFFSVALMPLVFKAPDGDRIQIANVRSAVEMAKTEDRIFDEQMDAEHKFKVTTFAPQLTDEFNQRSQRQTDITRSAAPIPTANTTQSIDIDQSLAIEFPIAAYEPHKFAGANKRHPPRRAKVASNQLRRPKSSQANAEANYYKPIDLPPPNFTISAY
jgi:hypothetical protein